MREIMKRGVRYKEAAQLPPLKGLRLVGRYIKLNSDGEVTGVQYALYFKNDTYTVDVSINEAATFFNELGCAIKANKIRVPLVTGEIQAWSGEDTSEEVQRSDG